MDFLHQIFGADLQQAAFIIRFFRNNCLCSHRYFGLEIATYLALSF